MSILSGDLQILASENMSDASNGGGSLVARQIVDGQSNNIFKSISSLNRTYGGVMMAKCFCACRSQNDDTLLGALVFLDKIPADTKLGVNLFSTGDSHDIRTDAIARVEAYRVQGGKYLGFLYGKAYQGSQSITIFQPVSAPVPANGDVLFLQSLTDEQYIRITSVSSNIETLTDANGTYQRNIVNLGIATPLVANFTGADMSRLDVISPETAIYMSTIADAARYYSTRYLPTGAAFGGYSVNVDTVYSQVVPSSQKESPLVDLTAASNVTPLIQSTTNTITMPINFAIGANVSIYAGRSIYPGSLAIAYSGGTVVDSGGQLIIGGTSVGVVNYATGMITFGANAPNIGSGSSMTFYAAGSLLAVADTDSIPVTDTSRSFVYTFNINPPPQPGALEVSMMALGNWYLYNDNGAGGLVANTPNTGAGTVNYVTGSVAITFSALPDIGSAIMIAWGKKVDYTQHAGTVVAMTINKQLAHDALDASTFAITWEDRDGSGNPVARQITSTSAGVLSGDGSGQLVAVTGYVSFKPNPLPPKGTVFGFSYLYGAGSGSASKSSKSLTSFNMTGNTVELDLGDTNIIAGSLVVNWDIPWGSSTTLQNQGFLDQLLANSAYIDLPVVPNGILVRQELDNGTGAFIARPNGINRNANINYSTGIVSFDWHDVLNLSYPTYGKMLMPVTGTFAQAGMPAFSIIKSLFLGYSQLPALMSQPAGFNVTYRTNSATTAGTDSLTLTAATLSVAVGFSDAITPNSVNFTFADKYYTDRLGQLYTDIDPATGAGTYAGTIDYAAGMASLTTWQVGASNDGLLIGAISTSSFTPVSKVVLRTASAPIKPSSFSIRATPSNGGGQITATADDSGNIQTSAMFGTVNYNTGVATIQFGALVTAAGNESASWYDASNVINGQIFKPAAVLAESIIYNAVSYTFLPLSSAILGLDPARLPIDGRIPVYRDGDVVVVLNDQSTSLTAASNTATNLGRTRLSRVIVKDLGGNLLALSKYTANLDTGVITWGDLSGISQPLTITDRVQDMAVIADVQIDGTITLSTPLTHDYPAWSLVANAVVLNDLFATASTPFNQATWTNVFSDTAIGSGSPAQYDHTNYPISVINSGAIEERWVLIFTSQTTFNVIGEHVGQIVSGATTATDLAPINPETNDPYFTLLHGGFGSGWYAGNCLRFNTYQAAAPVWIIQSILQGDATSSDLSFSLSFAGDVTR